MYLSSKPSLSDGGGSSSDTGDKFVCQGTLQYWDGVSKPYFYMTPELIPPGENQMFKITPLNFAMSCMRTLAASTTLSLETSGFELHRHTTALAPSDFLEKDKVTGAYYEEMRKLFREKIPEATRVIIFDHNVRAANLALFTETNRFEEGQQTKVAVTGPVRFAHNDYTHKSGPLRVQALTKSRGSGGSYTSDKPLLSEAEAEQMLTKRFAIVQAWRPINKPVKGTRSHIHTNTHTHIHTRARARTHTPKHTHIPDCPLAILDARSIKESDLAESTLIYPDREGYTYIVAPNAEHKWYFVPDMHRDEVMLFKVYDSQLDGRTRFGAHSAFDIVDAPADAPPRESIEIRALVCFDEPRSVDGPTTTTPTPKKRDVEAVA